MVINGTASNDELFGSGGDDILFGLGGDDWLSTGSGKDTLIGGDGNDTLRSGYGNDSLSGGTGADNLDGGDGNDTYIVENILDVAAEPYRGTLGGIDTVRSSVNYTLSANLENLLLEGVAAINGTGNALANNIYGNSAANVLTGEGGNDLLRGGGGNDTITGGSGNDFISSDAGNDILTGGTGFDRFDYYGYASFNRAYFGIDTITDFTPRFSHFTPNVDKINLGKYTFTALRSIPGTGFSDLSDFAQVTSDTAAAISSAPIVYNSANGKLFYNPNGILSGFASSPELGGHFITLTGNPVISSNDFLVVSDLFG